MKEKKDIKQVSWFDDHFYKVGDEYYPSVTTKMEAEAKPWLGKWRGDVGNREANIRMRDAADRGSRIHYAWYCLTTGSVVIYNPPQNPVYTDKEVYNLVKGHDDYIVLDKQDEMWDVYKLHKWHEIVQPEVLGNELIVYSDKNREAGQLDKLVKIKEGEYDIAGAKKLKLPEGIYVIDLKTGTMPATAYMQIAAYASCFMEMTSKVVKGGLVIHTGSTTKKGVEGLTTYYRSIEEMGEDYEDYRAVATVWNRRFSSRKPKIFEFPSILKIS